VALTLAPAVWITVWGSLTPKMLFWAWMVPDVASVTMAPWLELARAVKRRKLLPATLPWLPPPRSMPAIELPPALMWTPMGVLPLLKVLPWIETLSVPALTLMSMPMKVLSRLSLTVTLVVVAAAPAERLIAKFPLEPESGPAKRRC
jgi:hypothetical protein